MAIEGLVALAPRLWQAAEWTWTFASQAAERASALSQLASKDCRQAIVFAGNICLGYTPPEHAPGFGPFALAWGWCAVGALVGMLVGLHLQPVLSAIAAFARRGQTIGTYSQPIGAPPGLQMTPAWRRFALEALVHCVDPNRRIML